MVDKLWNKSEISQEEMKTVNTIVRCYRYLYGGYKDKKYTKKQWEYWKSRCIYAFNLCEWYYSEQETLRRDYRNWKESNEMINTLRDEVFEKFKDLEVYSEW